MLKDSASRSWLGSLVPDASWSTCGFPLSRNTAHRKNRNVQVHGKGTLCLSRTLRISKAEATFQHCYFPCPETGSWALHRHGLLRVEGSVGLLRENHTCPPGWPTFTCWWSRWKGYLTPPHDWGISPKPSSRDFQFFLIQWQYCVDRNPAICSPSTLKCHD